MCDGNNTPVSRGCGPQADFKYFGWKVPEEVEDSPSRSPTRSPVRSEYSD